MPAVEKGTDVKNTIHGRLGRSHDMNQTSHLPAYTKIATFSIGFKLKKFFLNVYLFLRQRQSVSGGGAESEGDPESETGSRL